MQVLFDFLASATAVDHLYLPLTVAVLIMALGRQANTDQAPVFAIAGGFVTSFSLAVTPIMPLWPPVGAIGKLPYVIIGSTVLSSLLHEEAEHRLAIPLGIVGTLATVLWLGHGMADPLERYPLWSALLVLISAGVLATVQLELSRTIAGIQPLALITALLVLALAAMEYGSRLGLHILALTGAVGGVLIAGRLLGYRRWGRAETFVTTMGVMAMATIMFLMRETLALPVGLAFLSFFVGEIGRLVAQYLGGDSRIMASGSAMVILALAVAWAL